MYVYMCVCMYVWVYMYVCLFVCLFSDALYSFVSTGILSSHNKVLRVPLKEIDPMAYGDQLAGPGTGWSHTHIH